MIFQPLLYVVSGDGTGTASLAAPGLRPKQKHSLKLVYTYRCMDFFKILLAGKHQEAAPGQGILSPVDLGIQQLAFDFKRGVVRFVR